MANPIIVPKKSTIAARVPANADLASGEICINHADKKLYAKHPSTGAIQEIGGMSVHSHDELYSPDSSQVLELQNNSDLTITAGGATKTFTLPSASGTIATLSDITASVAGVTSVNTRVGAVTLSKSDVGLGNVDNTSDVNKPISTATQTALDGKAETSHTHTISATNGLQSTLDAKIQKVTNDVSPVSTIRCMTQTEYDTLGSYDPQTLYFIK
jgi:hypothetical protein